MAVSLDLVKNKKIKGQRRRGRPAPPLHPPLLPCAAAPDRAGWSPVLAGAPRGGAAGGAGPPIAGRGQPREGEGAGGGVMRGRPDARRRVGGRCATPGIGERLPPGPSSTDDGCWVLT